jgi:hypothetical protein
MNLSKYIDDEQKLCDALETYQAVLQDQKSSDEKVEIKYQTIQYNLINVPGGLLTPLNPSTATIQGRFTNVDLTSDLVHIFEPLTGNIIRAKSNDGEIVNQNYVPPPIEEKKSKRGRKKKEKQKTKRCKNGAFGSMIQFMVQSLYRKNKVYKIKAFNKETFQVPGVLDPQFNDVIPALNELSLFLEKRLGSEKVFVQEIKPLMRNYTCRITNPNYRINLAAFAKFIARYQTSDLSKYDLLNKLRQNKTFKYNNLIQEIEKFLPVNRMGIVSIQYDLEKYAGIKIKFRRPLHKIRTTKDELKDITIKIYQSGKINIDGGKEVAEIEELYIWLNDILVKNFDELIIDVSQIVIENEDLIEQTDFNSQVVEESDMIKINTNEKNNRININRNNFDEEEHFDEEESGDEFIDDEF